MKGHPQSYCDSLISLQASKPPIAFNLFLILFIVLLSVRARPSEHKNNTVAVVTPKLFLTRKLLITAVQIWKKKFTQLMNNLHVFSSPCFVVYLWGARVHVFIWARIHASHFSTSLNFVITHPRGVISCFSPPVCLPDMQNSFVPQH